MEHEARDGEETCSTFQILRSSQQLAEHVAACIKQEAAEDDCAQKCFREIRKDHYGHFDVMHVKVECNDAQDSSVDVNCVLQSTFCKDEEKSGVSTRSLSLAINAVKNEDNQNTNEPWSLLPEPGTVMLLTTVKQEEECKVEVEDHVLCKLQPGFGKQEAYDDDTDCFEHADLHEQSTGDVDDEEATDCLMRHVKSYHNDTVQKCSKTKWQKNVSPHSRFQRHSPDASLYNSTDQHLKFQYDPDTELYQCTDCDHTTKYKTSLTAHLKVPHDAEPYECTACGVATKHAVSLTKCIVGKHNSDGAVYQSTGCSYTAERKQQNLVPNKLAVLYKCPRCEFVASHQSRLIEHFRLKHNAGAKLYKCTECSCTTRTHIENCHNRYAELYKCPHCDFATKNDKSLSQHLKVQHDPNPKLYKRTVCDYTSKCRKYLTRHVAVKHDSDAPVYQCIECSYASKVKHHLLAHIKNHHNRNVEVYKCPHCDFSAKNNNSLTRHVKVKHDLDLKPYKCTGAIQHIRVQHDPSTKMNKSANCDINRVRYDLNGRIVYQCAECRYTCKRKEQLSLHVEIKHTDHAPPYECPRCDFTTHYKASLTNHLKLQHDPDAALYKCADCDYATKDTVCLTKHVNIKHRSDAPVYRCAMCPFTATHKYYLTRHSNVKHNSDAPVYQCANCSYATKEKHNLSKHIKVLHNTYAVRYKCPHCDYAPKYKHHLAQHLKVQHGPNANSNFATKHAVSWKKHTNRKQSRDAPVYQCAICNYMTRRKGDLSAHIKHHDDRRTERVRA